MASEETIREVYRTLQAYTVLWYPLEPRKTDGASFDYAMALELLNRVEQDLETGLTFIREVEKGSHMKMEAVIGFRPEAIKALCELCRGRIHALKPGLDGNGKKGDGEDEEEERGGEGDGDRVGEARAHEVGKSLVDTIYRDIEPELKTRLQLLIHQRKRKARSK